MGLFAFFEDVAAIAASFMEASDAYHFRNARPRNDANWAGFSKAARAYSGATENIQAQVWQWDGGNSRAPSAAPGVVLAFAV